MLGRSRTTEQVLEKVTQFHEALLIEPGLRPMLRNLLNVAIRGLGVERAAVFLYHADDDELRGEVGTGQGSSHTVSTISVPLRLSGPIQQAFFGPREGLELDDELLIPIYSNPAPAEGSPFCWSNSGALCNLNPRVAGPERAARCPTCRHFGGVGVLVLQGFSPDPQTRQLLPVLARMVSLALRNAQMYDTALDHTARLSQHTRTLELVNRISGTLVGNLEFRQLLEALAWGLYRDMGFYRATITLNRGGVLEGVLTIKGGQLFWTEGYSRVQFKIQDSQDPFARAARERRPLVARQTLPPEARTCQMGFVPILTEDEVLGVLALDHGDGSAEITDEDLRYVQLMSHVAGVALKNAFAFEERERANRALSLERQKLHHALELLGDAVIVLEGPQGFANRKAQEILGLGQQVSLQTLPPALRPALEGKPLEYSAEGRTFSALGTRDGQLSVLILHEITAIRKAQRGLEAQSRFLGLLANITRQALESPDTAHLLSTLSARLTELFSAHQVYITFWDSSKQSSVPVWASGFSAQAYANYHTAPSQRSFTELALRLGRVLAVEDVRITEYADSQVTGAFPSAAVLVLPLIAKSRWLGAAILGYNQVRTFSQNQLTQAEQAAPLLALALLKTRLLEEIERRERRLKALLENNQDVVCVASARGVLQYVSPNVHKVFGFDPENHNRAEVSGLDFFHPDDRLEAQALLEQVVAQPNGTRASELRIVDAQGVVRHVDVWARNLLDDPDVAGVAFTLRDISERHRAQNALRESEARVRAILQALPDTLFVFGTDGVLLTFQGRRDRLLSAGQQLLGQHIRQIFPESVAEPVEAALRAVVASGEMHNVELGLEAEGGRQDYEVRLARIGDGQILAVLRDITEQKQLERMKRDFVSAVSHELRTPLMGILGFAELLIEDLKPNPVSLEFAQLIRESGLRLKNMVDNLLDTSRLEEGWFEVNRRRVDLSPTLREVAEAFLGVAQLDGISLEIELEPLPVLAADPDRIGQVVGNLLSNAFKFTPRGGRILMRGWAKPGWLMVEVRDSGPGIPEEQRERLFQRYGRTHTALERGMRGTGLGLYISKAIVEVHEGRIEIDSQPGQGACFRVCLPVRD